MPTPPVLDHGPALAVVLLGGLAAGAWLRERPPRGLGFAVSVAVLAVPVFLPVPTFVGTEGVLDMATPGVLLVLAAHALRARARLLALACLLVAGEEVDWGQRLWFFPTPPALAALPSRSTDLNFHNLAGLDVLWQPLPLVLLVLSALRARLPPSLGRALLGAGVPPVTAPTGPVLVGLAAASLALVGWVGERPADEAFELASVWALLVGWAPAPVRPTDAGAAPAAPPGAPPADV